MAKLVELLYKYDLIENPKNFSSKESCCFLNKENPVKFKANNEILLGMLKKVP